jgi:ABC-type phosphate transport system permease subunit
MKLSVQHPVMQQKERKGREGGRERSPSLLKSPRVGIFFYKIFFRKLQIHIMQQKIYTQIFFAVALLFYVIYVIHAHGLKSFVIPLHLILKTKHTMPCFPPHPHPGGASSSLVAALLFTFFAILFSFPLLLFYHFYIY